MRLAADGRHAAAFQVLLERHAAVATAWKRWEVAGVAYKKLTAKWAAVNDHSVAGARPGSVPTAYEWWLHGAAIFWWLLSNGTVPTRPVEVLRGVLAGGLPNFATWSPARRREVLALPGLKGVEEEMSARQSSGIAASAEEPETDDALPVTMAWSDNLAKNSSAPASPPPNDTDYWYVNHAGVVLLHPFLEPLFTALGYYLDGAFVDDPARQRAVYLTHYLATGAHESYEEDLSLCKLLCGWPVSGPPARLTAPLTDTDRREADEVLRSVIEHWPAIGTATPEGLREGFFARDGRLHAGENGWRVTVERRGQDILLGKLPWGISMVRAGWHEAFIKVDW